MAAATRTVTHPDWCSLDRCRTTHHDTLHAEQPDVIVGVDGPLSLALVQDDDNTTGAPEAELSVGDGTVHLDLAGIRALRAWAAAAEARATTDPSGG